jgi:hypothetical protein
LNWNPSLWKRSTRILLGLLTIWPVIYIGLFVVSIFSFMLLMPFAADRSTGNCGELDLIQLTEKIQNRELKQLTIKSDEIIATDRVGACDYHTSVSNERTRSEIIRKAKATDANNAPLVAKVEEETSRPRLPMVFPIGFVALFALHALTIFLTIALMPLYIVLAVKSDRLDETTRIIWVVLFCTIGMLGMPVYWYLYIWREPRVPPANGPVAQPPENKTIENDGV